LEYVDLEFGMDGRLPPMEMMEETPCSIVLLHLVEVLEVVFQMVLERIIKEMPEHREAEV
jgi:hypothetical protein